MDMNMFLYHEPFLFQLCSLLLSGVKSMQIIILIPFVFRQLSLIGEIS